MTNPAIEPSPSPSDELLPPDRVYAHLGHLLLWAKTVDVVANGRERARLIRELFALAERCESRGSSQDVQLAGERIIRPAVQLLQTARDRRS